MRLIGMLFILMLLHSPAQADCVTPAGVEGQMLYNSTYKTMQFCDGTNWYSMKGGSASGIDDLADVDTSGKATNDVLSWDGTNWAGSAPSGGGSTNIYLCPNYRLTSCSFNSTCTGQLTTSSSGCRYGYSDNDSNCTSGNASCPYIGKLF